MMHTQVQPGRYWIILILFLIWFRTCAWDLSKLCRINHVVSDLNIDKRNKTVYFIRIELKQCKTCESSPLFMEESYIILRCCLLSPPFPLELLSLCPTTQSRNFNSNAPLPHLPLPSVGCTGSVLLPLVGIQPLLRLLWHHPLYFAAFMAAPAVLPSAISLPRLQHLPPISLIGFFSFLSVNM